MIFSEITAGKEMILGGWLCSTPAKVITIPTEADVVDFCTCNFICDYEEDAYTFLTDPTDEYKNDYRSVLITLRDASSSYEFFLVNSSDVEIPLIDNTYGELFDLGFNTKQPLKAGYRIDWVKVFELLGVGKYKIRVKQTDFSNTITVDSHTFNVREFNELQSNHTVKLEYVQTGQVLNGENYSGMEWRNMVRIKGTFKGEAPQYEQDRVQDANYKDIDIQVEKFNQYSLSTELLPDFIGDLITDGVALTDVIYISTNDIFNYKQYRKLEVTFTGDLEPGEDYSRNNRKPFVVTFKDAKSKLKRNFV
jgi:hypothetical protein